MASPRVLITGAARGIGAALAERLHDGGARVALAGLEPDRLAAVARRCAAPWRECDVGDPAEVETAVAELVAELGGLDVVVANAGIAKQLPIIGGDPSVMADTLRVNLLGTYHTLRFAGEHIAHPGGYALAIASLSAAVHVPLLGAYSASKAGVAALADTLRTELAPTGARVGVAYFAELDTDMTSRGFGTRAAAILTGGGSINATAPLRLAVDALEHGIATRARRVVAPKWVGLVLPVRGLAQRVIERRLGTRVSEALAIARTEDVPFTTPQPTTEPGTRDSPATRTGAGLSAGAETRAGTGGGAGTGDEGRGRAESEHAAETGSGTTADTTEAAGGAEGWAETGGGAGTGGRGRAESEHGAETGSGTTANAAEAAGTGGGAGTRDEGRGRAESEHGAETESGTTADATEAGGGGRPGVVAGARSGSGAGVEPGSPAAGAGAEPGGSS